MVTFIAFIYLVGNLIPWLILGFDPAQFWYYAPRIFAALAFLLITRSNVISGKNLMVIVIGFSLVVSYRNMFAPTLEPLLALPPFFRFFYTFLPPVPILAHYITGPRWGPLFTVLSIAALAKGFYSSLDQEVTFTLTLNEHLQFFVIAILVQVLPMMFLMQFEAESVLYHTFLLASLKDAEEKSRAKTTFISRMSHELRTPLQGLLSSVALLRDTSLSEDQVTFMTLIDSCGELLLSIVEKILDITRIESGRFETADQPFNLLTLVPSILQSVISIASAKGLQLHLYFDLHQPHGTSAYEVEGDHKHLRGILTNLIGNAIKFTERGHIVVAVTAKPTHDQAFSLIRVEIKDTGRGIPERILPELFEPFTKAHNYHQSEGSGLGLSIVKRFAEAMGGSVGVNTKVGVGSIFWVEIPFRRLPSGVLGLSPLSLPALPSPCPTFGVYAQGQTLAALVEYLTYLRIPFSVVEDPAHLSHFTHLIVEEAPPVVFGSALFTQARREGRLALVYLSSFGSHLPLKEEFETDGGRPDQVAVIAPPLTPIKITRALRKVLQLGGGSGTLIQNAEEESEQGSSFPSARVPRGSPVHQMAVPASLDVLLVEDNVVNQLVMRKLFEKLRVSFAVTSSAEECIEIWKHHSGRISLILMDVELDGPMTGLEATRVIRGLERDLQVPPSFIGIMTGRSLEDDRRAAEESGSNEFLVKPVVFEKIRDLVSRVVTRGR